MALNEINATKEISESTLDSMRLGHFQGKTVQFRFWNDFKFKAFVLTAVWLLVTRVFETGVWVIVYSYAVGGEKFANFKDAACFSNATFTKLGDIVIEGHWRMLSACQAKTGSLVFGWSTALLFAVV